MDKETLIVLEKQNRVELAEAERSRVLDLFDVLAAGEKTLDMVDAENVERMVHLSPMNNIFREDVSLRQFSRGDLLKGAPEQSDGYWQVPRLME